MKDSYFPIELWRFDPVTLWPCDFVDPVTLRPCDFLEFTFVITKEEAEEIYGQGQNFITSIIEYLKESAHII